VGVSLRVGQHRLRVLQAGLLGAAAQHLGVAGVQSLRVVGAQQGVLEPTLRGQVLLAGRVQQAVGVEGVPDARAGAESEAQFGAAFADALLVVGDLRRRDAVLGLQVGDHLLALGAHAGVQLEGLEADLGAQTGADQRRLQRVQADHAPGAGDVGDEVDGDGVGVGVRVRVRDPRA
jgi:hypothetical protein